MGKEEPAVQDTVEPAAQDNGNEPVGDGLDALRREIAGSPSATREEKLAAALAELVGLEKHFLRRYKEARDKGDTVEMDSCRGHWKSVSEQMEMLRGDPDKYAKLHGL